MESEEVTIECEGCGEKLIGIYKGDEDKYVFECVPCKKRLEIFPAEEDVEEDTMKVIYNLE